MYKVSKTIPMPGAAKTGKRGRKNRLSTLPIESIKVGESVQLMKVTPNISVGVDKLVSKFSLSIKNLVRAKNLGGCEFVVMVRSTPKRGSEIRMWRTK